MKTFEERTTYWGRINSVSVALEHMWQNAKSAEEMADAVADQRMLFESSRRLLTYAKESQDLALDVWASTVNKNQEIAAMYKNNSGLLQEDVDEKRREIEKKWNVGVIATKLESLNTTKKNAAIYLEQMNSISKRIVGAPITARDADIDEVAMKLSAQAQYAAHSIQIAMEWRQEHGMTPCEKYSRIHEDFIEDAEQIARDVMQSFHEKTEQQKAFLAKYAFHKDPDELKDLVSKDVDIVVKKAVPTSMTAQKKIWVDVLMDDANMKRLLVPVFETEQKPDEPRPKFVMTGQTWDEILKVGTPLVEGAIDDTEYAEQTGKKSMFATFGNKVKKVLDEYGYKDEYSADTRAEIINKVLQDKALTAVQLDRYFSWRITQTHRWEKYYTEGKGKDSKEAPRRTQEEIEKREKCTQAREAITKSSASRQERNASVKNISVDAR